MSSNEKVKSTQLLVLSLLLLAIRLIKQIPQLTECCYFYYYFIIFIIFQMHFPYKHIPKVITYLTSSVTLLIFI